MSVKRTGRHVTLEPDVRYSRELNDGVTTMTTVLLIHHDKVPLPHYRVQNYKYLHSYLHRYGYELQVWADDGARHDSPGFPLRLTTMSLSSIARLVETIKPAVCILVVNHRQPYFFLLLLYLRFQGVKVVTWTHGTDLQHSSSLSTLAHHTEHELCDGIVLYAEPMRMHLLKRHQRKAFVANNTLNLTEYPPRRPDRAQVLGRHGITTAKNVIFVGRVHARKRIGDLLAAFERVTTEDCGLVIVGPDEEGVLEEAAKKPRVYVLGPLYGDEVLDLLACADVYCIPGAIGLSIVDAMFSGLPVVTERVAHGPEIMYLHEGENGFMVPQGDTGALAERLSLLLADEQLRRRFSQRARDEIETRGHIDELCRGVLQSLDYVTSNPRNSPSPT